MDHDGAGRTTPGRDDAAGGTDDDTTAAAGRAAGGADDPDDSPEGPAQAGGAGDDPVDAVEAVDQGASRPGRRRRRERLQLGRALPVALGVGAGILLAEATLAMVFRLRSILTLLLLSLFLSFAIEPAVQWLHTRGVRRGLGTGIVYVVSLGLTVGFVAAVSGLVADQVVALSGSVPNLLDDLASRAQDLPEGLREPVMNVLEGQSTALPDRLSSAAGQVANRAVGLGSTLVGGIFSLLTVALVTFYLVADGPRLRRTLLRRLEPSRQRELVDLWELAIAKTGGYVYSRLVLAVASAAVHVTAFTFFDLPYAAALGIWVGLVSSIVPVVGTYIAGAVPLVVSLAEPDASTLGVLGTIVVYQQVENYLVQPRITAHTLELNPAVALVSVIAGAALLGAVGALLALPVAAIVAALFATYADEHEVLEETADWGNGRSRSTA